MARGRLLKSKVKEAKALVKAKLQASKEWEERNANIEYSLKKELVMLLRRTDPLELVIWGSTTYLLYNVFQASEEFTGKIVDIVAMLAEAPFHWLDFPFGILGFIFGRTVLGEKGPLSELEALSRQDKMQFITAMLCAFILVRHPDMAISTLTNITHLGLGLLK